MYNKKRANARVLAFLLSTTLAFSTSAGTSLALAGETDGRGSVDASLTPPSAAPEDERGMVSAQESGQAVIPSDQGTPSAPQIETPQPAQTTEVQPQTQAAMEEAPRESVPAATPVQPDAANQESAPTATAPAAESTASAEDIAVKAEDSAASAGTTAADNTKKMTTLAIVGSETEQDGQVTDSPEQDEVQPTAPSDKEYLTVSIRYKDPEAEKSQLKELAVTADQELTQMSDNMSWAAGVAQIGMLLRESEFAGSSDYDEVRSRMQELTGDDEYREEFIYLINRLKGVKLEDPDYGYDADNYYEEW